jgi:hypothetical protein
MNERWKGKVAQGTSRLKAAEADPRYWSDIQTAVPLSTGEFWLAGEVDETYNCLACTIDDPTREVWPEGAPMTDVIDKIVTPRGYTAESFGDEEGRELDAIPVGSIVAYGQGRVISHLPIELPVGSRANSALVRSSPCHARPDRP